MYGKHFDVGIISDDFKIIKDAGLNTIRIFVPYEDFGKANVISKKLDKLKTVLDIAHKQDLKVAKQDSKRSLDVMRQNKTFKKEKGDFLPESNFDRVDEALKEARSKNNK